MAKLLSPQHVCARHNLDFDEEQDLLKKAEKAGWQMPTEVPMVGNKAENVDNKKETDTMRQDEGVENA